MDAPPRWSRSHPVNLPSNRVMGAHRMIGRPGSSEAAPYYFRYIDHIASDDVVRVMADQLVETVAWCATISDERSLHRYAADKWSIRQVLSHITDSERVFAFRALWFARGFDSALPSFDQAIAAAGANADRIAWAAQVEDFQRVRLASISLFANLAPEAWMRGGIASDTHVTVRALAYIITGHLAHHRSVVDERY